MVKPKIFWRLAYMSEQDAERMIGFSSFISPRPFQKDTVASIKKKVSTDIRVGHGIILANFDDSNKAGKAIAAGLVTEKSDAITIKWKRINSDLSASSSSAIGYWRHSSLFKFYSERAKELKLAALFDGNEIESKSPTISHDFENSPEHDATSDIFEIVSDSNLRETEKRLLVSARIGQGYFRDELIKYWKGCAVTGLKNPTLLRASHIKPWAASTNQERLDPYNGLLLVPNIDLLFDEGFISFGEKGELLTSKKLSATELESMGVNSTARILVEDRHEEFLSYHRSNVFKS